MSASQNNEKNERRAILKAMGIKTTIIPPPEFHKTECTICLKKIHKGEQKTLDCKHVFHGCCLRKWAMRNTEGNVLQFRKPIKNRRIHLYKKGENIFTCPCCRIEYTHDVITHNIKQVFATVHLKDKGDDVVHYITDPMETVIFVPSTEFDEDDCVNGKWATILSLLKHAWEQGTKDIYANYRLYPEPEFVLGNDHLKIPPLDKTTGMPLNINEKQALLFREVELDELNELLNNE